MKKIFTVPNCMTLFRIFGSIVLIFVKPLSVPFFVVYTLSGISDAFDGLIARATKTTSTFGAKLDSVADLTFYAVMILRLFSILWDALPGWIWGIVFSVIGLRVLSYIAAWIKFHVFSSMHTYLNKTTGLLVFAVPYMLDWLSEGWFTGYCALLGSIAGLASLEELLVHLTSSEYRSDFKSVIMK